LTWSSNILLKNLADKIKRISLIRDKTNVIKNYLNEIKEEDNSFTTNGGHKEEKEEELLTPLKKSLQINLTSPQILSAALKTPTEEALAFIEKAKIQIKKQNSLINQNESTNESSPQHHKQLNKTTNDNKIQNLLTELSLDDQPFEDEEHDEHEEEEHIQQTSLQLINNSSDQSTQLIDVDRYRIDFTTNDDDITTTTTTTINNTPIIKTNGGDESSIDESLLKEKEKNYIKYLQEENAKFK
jgi:hypothetical protein